MSNEESERITTSQDVISRLHDKIDEQQARIAELEERLEIDYRHPYDGIAARDVTIKALDERIAELESQLEAIGAGGVESLRKQVAPQAAVPDGWRDQFSESVYEDLSAACNQDVPLEEYPARILNILDAIVGPRHPTVIKWRNDAIRSCIAIAYKYCSDPESYRYLKQDLEAMLASPAHPAEGEVQ